MDFWQKNYSSHPLWTGCFLGKHPYSTSFFLELEKKIFTWLETQAKERGQSLPVLVLFWETNTEAIVLGLSQNVNEEIFLDKVHNEQILVLRRRSGGGTVLHGRGNLCYSVFIPYELHPSLASVPESFAFISEPFLRALNSKGIAAQFFPYSDWAVVLSDGSARKFSGNAQWRRRNYILQHGTILFDLSIDRIAAFLREPVKKPPYRQNRLHTHFLCQLSDYALSPQEFLQSFWPIFCQPFSTVDSFTEGLANCHVISDSVKTRDTMDTDGFPSAFARILEETKISDGKEWEIKN